MADAPDSKSGRGNPVWVQVPPPAPSSVPLSARLSLRLRQIAVGTSFFPAMFHIFTGDHNAGQIIGRT